MSDPVDGRCLMVGGGTARANWNGLAVEAPPPKLRSASSGSSPSVDVLVVVHNGAEWIPGLCESLRNAAWPAERLRLVVVDNASTDDSLEVLDRSIAELPFPVDVIECQQNRGFTGGYELALEHANADYWFVLNQDTKVAADAIPLLVEALEGDSEAAIAEARQSPNEHPKYWDPFTRETSWCSGACMMLRRAAVEQVGGFDPSFFLYAEDVDLSWRMWLHGWKCLYVSEAVVEHFNENFDEDHEPRTQRHYSMRNSLLMRIAYGSLGEILLHLLAMLRLIVGRAGGRISDRWGVFRSLCTSAFGLPAALRKRRRLRPLTPHRWVQFNGWEYGRHMTDLAEQAPPSTFPAKGGRGLVSFAKFRALAAAGDFENVDVEPQVDVAGRTEPAILMYRTAELRLEVAAGPGAVLTGVVGAPADQRWPYGRFTIDYNGRRLWRFDRNPNDPACQGWRRFAVALPQSTGPAALSLRFQTLSGRPIGYWADVNLMAHPAIRVAGLGPNSAASKSAVSNRSCEISVVVPTHDRAEKVVGVLHRLLVQDDPGVGYEIVVVDSCSSDATPLVLAEFARDPRVRTRRVEKPGAAAARNAGLERARGSLVVMMDDDVLVRRDFLASVWKAHRRRPDRVLLANIVAPYDGVVDPFLRYMGAANEVNVYDFPNPDDVPGDYFYTGCVAVPAEVLGGLRFDENFTVYGVEDVEFGLRLIAGGAKMAFLRELAVWHDYHPEHRTYVRKRKASGFSLGYLLRKKPWCSRRYRFEEAFTKRHCLLAWKLRLLRPLAAVVECWERSRYSTGPVKPFLHRWYQSTIRLSLYEGLLQYKRHSRMEKRSKSAPSTALRSSARVSVGK